MPYLEEGLGFVVPVLKLYVSRLPCHHLLNIISVPRTLGNQSYQYTRPACCCISKPCALHTAIGKFFSSYWMSARNRIVGMLICFLCSVVMLFLIEIVSNLYVSA